MKCILKNALKFLFIYILLVTSSCEKDLYETKSDLKNIRFKTMSLSQVRRISPKSAKALLDANIKVSDNGYGLSKEIFGYEIDTTKIEYIIKEDGYQSFTFSVKAEIGESMLKNIVVSTFPDNRVEVVLAKYNLNKIIGEIEDEKMLKEAIVSSKIYRFSQYGNKFSGFTCIDVGYFIELEKCEGELVTPEERPDCFNSDGSKATKEVFVLLASGCINGGGIDSGGTPTDNDGNPDPPSSGSGGEELEEPNDIYPTNPSEDQLNNDPRVLTSPVLDNFDAGLAYNKARIIEELMNGDLGPVHFSDLITLRNRADEIINYLHSDNSTDSIHFIQQLMINMLENPALKFDITRSSKSPMNIDLSKVQDTSAVAKRLRCIYDKLTQSEHFKNLFINTFGPSERFNAQIELVDDLPNGATGNCQLVTRTENGVTKYYNIIKIKKSILTQGNSNEQSNFEAATTIIHEFMHAYLNIKKINCNNGATIPYLNNLKLGELISVFYQNFTCQPDANGSPQSQHEFIYNYMIPTFQNIFNDIRDILVPPNHVTAAEQIVLENPDLVITENWNWNNYYKYISLNGLHNCQSFISDIANVPSQNFLFNAYNSHSSYFSKNCD